MQARNTQCQPKAASEKTDEKFPMNTTTLSANRLKDLTQSADLEDVDYLEMCIDGNKLRIDNLGELLPNLKCLRLSNGISPQIRDIGSGFGKLEILWMSRCCLHSLEGLEEIKGIREIYFSFNDISDISPLGNLTKLEILDLEGLKCLDNIATQSARVQRDVQNECDFDDEWTYINSVIDEFVSTPYITKIESGTEQKIMAIGLRKIAGKSSLYSVNRPTSSIHLTPDEKRQRVQVDEDGTIHDRSDSKEIRKWAESLPEIKPVSLDLTSGSVMCGNIGKSLRQRRNSICTPILSNDTKDEKAQEIKPGTECKKESAGFDGETEATIIKGLQNECRNILYELEEWRAKFLSKPRKYATLNSTNPKWNNTSHSERFTSRARQKPRALPNVMQPVSTTTQSKGTISDHPADDSKCPDTDPQTAYIELKRTKVKETSH
ncbi:Leucine-rich repeat-containing protein 56 [Echinococcus granulosus]|uniref:Leucine-rich repeat-containing protein 56 n=1 Tax=Echinococcus granulosus TaxID=6210 RepID=W6UN12_ECHGR|nr:Leucine-rich repeat-containing protein 56 [Echinococcus granulosus]EUB62438.1 Leucine-rich repeat-containing protein 56 [Echinococcus granulosus]